MSLATSQEISLPTSNAVRVLPGPTALTAFEAERLAARLRAVDSGVAAVESAFLYILRMTEHPAPQVNDARLRDLLDLGAALPPGPCVWIAPRTGTQSPWSSKATDILHNTGFTAIERIERARAVRVTGARSLHLLATLLHDRMTETVFFESADELIFQDLDDLKDAITEAAPGLTHFDASVFDGIYVTGDVTEEYLHTLEQKRNDTAKHTEDVASHITRNLSAHL